MTELKESIRDSLKPLRQLDKEVDAAYHCFLLWCIQDPQQRSISLVERSSGEPKRTIQKWKKKYGWSNRSAAVPGCEIYALQLLRARMAEYGEDVQSKLLKSGIEAVLEEAAPASLRSYVRREQQGIQDITDPLEVKAKNASLPTPVLPIPPEEDLDLARYVRDKWLTRDKLDFQVKVIDMSIGYIAKAVAEGEVKVSLRDLPPLLKARALLTGMPTDNINLNANVNVQQVESYRVKLAKSQRGATELDIVNAIRGDIEEISAILGTIDGQEEVVPIDYVEVDEE